MNTRAILLSIAASLAICAAPLVAVADANPDGCVSCHVVGKDKVDHRISSMLKAWTAGKVDADLLAKTKASMPPAVAAKGKHPSAEDSLEDIPGACLDCHDPGSKKAPPFAQLMHLVHLTGANNEFIAMHKGDCTACHKLNTRNGELTIPSGPER